MALRGTADGREVLIAGGLLPLPAAVLSGDGDGVLEGGLLACTVPAAAEHGDQAATQGRTRAELVGVQPALAVLCRVAGCHMRTAFITMIAF